MNYFKVSKQYVNALTGLLYGQEELGYPALLFLLEYCTINFCAADIS
jgi:hypothetical protein